MPSSISSWIVPVLWDHPTDCLTTMNVRADVQAAPNAQFEDYARTLAGKASHLLVANRIYICQVRVATCYAPEPLLGSSWTPVSPLAVVY